MDLIRIGMTAVFKILYRKKIKLIHDLIKMGSADNAHITLLIIVFNDLIMQFQTGLLDLTEIDRVIGIRTSSVILNNKSENFFITENTADTSAPCLFKTHDLALAIIQRIVEHSNKRMFCRFAGGNGRNIRFVLFCLCKHIDKFFAEDMTVLMLSCSFHDIYFTFIAVDINDNVLRSFSLNFKSIKTGKFHKRSKKTADV